MAFEAMGVEEHLVASDVGAFVLRDFCALCSSGRRHSALFTYVHNLGFARVDRHVGVGLGCLEPAAIALTRWDATR